ncbi:MAG TPA: HD-GYP domain-containing protein [Streptosporangiaceae bacterium]|nr:HD-GYP domain-containing protein [Streptosporangiaceae bacterium]
MVTGRGRQARRPPAFSTIAWLYVLIVVAAGTSVLLRAIFPTDDWDVHVRWSATLVVLAVLFLVCDSFPTALTSRQSAWSPSTAATLAAVVLLGPPGAVVVGATSLLSVQRGLAFTQRVFNASMYALSASAAGETYLALGGRVGEPMPGFFPGILGPFAVAAVVHVLVNHGLLWGMLWLIPAAEAGPGIGTARHIPLLFISDVGYASLGLLIAALWRELPGPLDAVLVLIPLLVARWAMGQFSAQEHAYAATMAALCQAVETKDLYTRGHSERVSRGAVMIGQEIGMRANRVEAIRYAGMLHDVGKLGVPTTVLQKQGPLTEEEFAAIQLHPMRGLEIVQEIGFLDEALAGIMHHHERIDGLGYPMGLAGDEIPEFARVIAVADAFDAMTSDRSYRGARSVEAALADLKKWAGIQFDPAFVEAFTAVVAREGWAAPRPVAVAEVSSAQSQDHDDPSAPLRVVEKQ